MAHLALAVRTAVIVATAFPEDIVTEVNNPAGQAEFSYQIWFQGTAGVFVTIAVALHLIILALTISHFLTVTWRRFRDAGPVFFPGVPPTARVDPCADHACPVVYAAQSSRPMGLARTKAGSWSHINAYELGFEHGALWARNPAGETVSPGGTRRALPPREARLWLTP